MVDQPWDDFTDTDHVQDADILVGLRGVAGVNYLGSHFVKRAANGNFGIGTNPIAKFHINEPSASQCFFLAGNNNGGGALGVSSDGKMRIGGFATPEIRFGNYNAGAAFVEIARFDENGHFLCGKQSIGSEVTTDGAILFKNASGGGMTAYFTNGGNGTALVAATQANGNVCVFFRSGSQVGSINVTATSTSYNTSSDYRLKTDIEDLTESGTFIDGLRPRRGKWIADDSHFVGFIAHEFAEVSPSSVSGDKDAEQTRITVDDDGNDIEITEPNYQTMQASSPEVMANIIAELQSLRKRVAELEKAR